MDYFEEYNDLTTPMTRCSLKTSLSCCTRRHDEIKHKVLCLDDKKVEINLQLLLQLCTFYSVQWCTETGTMKRVWYGMSMRNRHVLPFLYQKRTGNVSLMCTNILSFLCFIDFVKFIFQLIFTFHSIFASEPWISWFFNRIILQSIFDEMKPNQNSTHIIIPIY